MPSLLLIEKRAAYAAYRSALAERDAAQDELERQALTMPYEPLGRPAWRLAYHMRNLAEFAVDEARKHLRAVESATRNGWVTDHD